MPRLSARHFGAALGLALGLSALAWLSSGASSASGRADTTQALRSLVLDVAASGSGPQTAIFAGGCFWGVQGVFEHVKGVTQAVSGYTGGSLTHPGYYEVSSGTTGHAKSVRVTYDPAVVSYGKLLQIFFSVALDPTQVNGQGPDWGTQYHSELFVVNADQERVARAYIAQLDAAHVFRAPIATRVDPAGPFYAAEDYHQDYLVHHPDAPYIAINDMPKVRSLETVFPQDWQAAPVLTGSPGAKS